MRAEIDTDLLHDADSQGVDVACGLRPCAFYTERAAELFAKNTFCQMGAAGISSTEDEDGRHGFEMKRKGHREFYKSGE